MLLFREGISPERGLRVDSGFGSRVCQRKRNMTLPLRVLAEVVKARVHNAWRAYEVRKYKQIFLWKANGDVQPS